MAEEAGVVSTVMVGGSAGVTMEDTMEAVAEVTMVAVGPIPGQIEGD